MTGPKVKFVKNNISRNKLFVVTFFSIIGIILTSVWLSVKSVAPTNIYQSLSNKTPNQAAQKAKEACADLKNTKFQNTIDCYVDFYYKLTLKKNTEFAYQALSEQQKFDKSARSCHRITHGIGWASYEREPERWKDTIGKMPVECDYGGIHGIIERFQSREGGSLNKKTLIEVCSKNPTDGCIHGVGHLVLVEAKNNIDWAIDLCSVYPEKEDRISCMAGVFMERMIPRNLTTHGMVNENKLQNWWVQIDEYEKLCRSYESEASVSCWTEISHAAARIHRSPDRVFGFCDNAPIHEASNACRRHIILDLVGMNQFDLLRIKEMCRLGPLYDSAFEEDCYREMVLSAAGSIEENKLQYVSDFCKTLAVQYKEGCFGAYGKALSARHTISKEQKKAACLFIPKEYQAGCLNKKI